MKTLCTKCGSDSVYIELPEQEKLPETQTMDEMINNLTTTTLVYKQTTWRCKNCGYSVSR